jgi:hypothetical protein
MIVPSKSEKCMLANFTGKGAMGKKWNCYKKIDSELSQIMQPVLVVGLNNLAFPPVFGIQAGSVN